MNILIIGGFGYIGSNLSTYFLDKGYDITIASKINSAYKNNATRFNVVELDIKNDNELTECLKEFQIIINTAGLNSAQCKEDVTGAIETNISLTALLGKSAIQAGVERMIHLSTAHVYRDPLVGYLDEKTVPFNVNPYAFSHLAGELSLQHLSTYNKTQFINMRLSNIFGGFFSGNKASSNLFVNDLCLQAIKNKQMIINSNHLQERDFLGMLTLCMIIEKFVTIDLDNIQYLTYNIGSGRSFTLEQMAVIIQSQIFKICNYKPPIIYTAKASVCPKLEYSISRLSELFNTSNIEIEEEISRFLNHIISIL